MNDNTSMKVFGLELNVGSFLGAIVAIFVYYLSDDQSYTNILSISLTLTLPIYLLKISRSYEHAKNNKLDFTQMLFFPKRNNIKNYIVNVMFVVVAIVIATLVIYFYNFGIHHAVNIFWKVVACYATFMSSIAAIYTTMNLIFDFIIATLFKLNEYTKKHYIE